MGFWTDLFMGRPSPAEFPEEQPTNFAVDAGSIPAEIFGLTSYADPIAPAARISRREAIQLPAVKRSRDLIAGALGGLPLQVLDTQNVEHVNDLLEQPEKSVPRSVTMTRTVEDMLFEGVAYWRVTERAFDGYPRYVQRVHPSRVTVNEDTGEVHVDGRRIDPADLIQFHSPNDPLLVAGARAIRTALRLDAACANYAEGAPPIDFFTPAEGADPADDADVLELLNAWKAARQSRSTAYVPAALKYNVGGWNPEQLQLADARQQAVLEIARVGGIDPEELGVSTTSRTYANQQDRRKAFLDFTLGGYMHAVEDRLSMGDITKRGYRVRFDLSDFLRSDDKTRMEVYKVGLEVGAIDKAEIREMENKPPLAQLPAPQQQEPSVSASKHTFSDPEPALRLDATPAGATFAVDSEKRTIRGLAVPYGVTAQSGGKRWQFAKGVIKFSDVKRIKLLAGHDWKQAIGHAVELEDTDEGLIATFRVARGAEGDRALSLAEDGVWDGLSGGFAHGITYDDRDGVFHATSAPLAEISLTPCPAYDDARVTAVAASSDLTKEEEGVPMTDKVETKTAESVDFGADVVSAIKDGFASLQGPEVVKPTAQFEVNEPTPYRFDGVKGEHDFSTDVINGLKGDSEAYGRVVKFMGDAFTPKFAVGTGNVSSLNPTRQRPDMYVDERKKSTPFYNALHKGTQNDLTPFVFPKFNSASGLVADHVEGTEPTPGAFSATSQTVTPSAVSGKVEITREVWDQGGNPQVSNLIWTKMVYAYYQAMETKSVAMLDAASPTQIVLTTGATDAALVNELEDELAALQFVAGGNSFNFAGTQEDLFRKLAAAVDGQGRKLLPIINPMNANGQSQSQFRAIDVAGSLFVPAWSLGASGIVSESSYLVDTDSVHVWNTPPQRLEFQYRVAYVDLAIWGYVATAISDLNGVREITYDPAV